MPANYRNTLIPISHILKRMRQSMIYGQIPWLCLHVYAENLLIYRLVKLKNIFSLHYPLVDDKLNDGTHSLVDFDRYIAKVIIDKYSYQCSNNPCLPCGRL